MTDRQKAIAYADREFSLYVRARDGNRCIICMTIGQTDCAHYVSREKLGTRWLEENGNALCRPCHQKDHNGDDQYTEALRRRYDEDTPESLILAGNTVVKLSTAEIREIGKDYHYKRKELERI